MALPSKFLGGVCSDVWTLYEYVIAAITVCLDPSLEVTD